MQNTQMQAGFLAPTPVGLSPAEVKEWRKERADNEGQVGNCGCGSPTLSASERRSIVRTLSKATSEERSEIIALVQEAENVPAVVVGSAEQKPAAPVPAAADPAAGAPASAGARPPEPADTDPPGKREEPPAEPTDRIVELKRRALSVWSVAEPTVVRVLVGVNYPLRLLPDPVRQIVDWIALTLVFWVPITWVIALFVIG